MADFSETFELQRRMTEAVDKLVAMTGTVAIARQVREFSSDRRKRVLAIAAMPFIKAGQSSASADTESRASEQYAEAMKQLGKELIAAEKAIAEWDATRITIECARSLLAMQRDSMRQL